MTTRLRLLVVGCSLILAAGGCGSPTTPSAPGVPLEVSVKGVAALGIGQTAQLAAVINSGQDVTTSAAWRSSDETVARVSATGLLRAIGAGTSVITAAFKGVAGTSTVLVSTVLLSMTITSCGNIVAAGAYVVANDISQFAASGACLKILTSAVQVDCRNHAVSGVLVLGVNGVTVSNCNTTPTVSFVEVTKSTNVTFDHNTLSTIYLMQGSGNQILQNTIDGGGGQDDGILLTDEANDTIQGNTIRNVFDAGIEGVDVVLNTVISNNTIVNAGVAGIASYWCTSWTGNTISGNIVSSSPWLLDFFYGASTAKCLNPSTVAAFANNQIIGNRFSSPIAPGGSMYFHFPAPNAGGVSSNLIQGNDLGATLGPIVDPILGFINGGGNICAPNSSPFCRDLSVMPSNQALARGRKTVR